MLSLCQRKPSKLTETDTLNVVIALPHRDEWLVFWSCLKGFRQGFVRQPPGDLRFAIQGLGSHCVHLKRPRDPIDLVRSKLRVNRLRTKSDEYRLRIRTENK